MKVFARALPVLLLALAWPAGAVDAPADALPAKVEFNRDIRPIFSDTCFKCHGFDANKRKKDLRLDLPDGAYKALKDGSHPVVPNHPEESLAYQRLVSDDPDELMPPADSGLKLTARQKALVKRWIEQGAQYQSHWSFITPTRPQLPNVNETQWVRNPIDAFTLAKLESEHLHPSPEADRPTLIRRLSLDLTGLPPTPAEVDAFIRDDSANAYEKVVDRLLASPRYGERMAMWWLDGARYADSHGYQADWERYQWPWRDWVINAFNRNERFDQFTIDQLAGDMLPNATQDQKVATGFNRNHRINTEGGIIPEEWRVESVIDRVETVSAVWLGLTTGCCRCHDHKYDPVTQKEFYELFAFFNNVNEQGTGAEKAGNHAPTMPVPSAEQQKRLGELTAAETSAASLVKEKEKDLPALLTAWEAQAATLKKGVEWTTLAPEKMDAAGEVTKTQRAKLAKDKDSAILVAGNNPATDAYTITLKTNLKQVTALRLDALPHATLGGGGPGRSSAGNFVLTHVDVRANGKPVKLARATADYSQDKYPVTATLDTDDKTGWAVYPKTNMAHYAVFSFDKPVASETPITLTVRLDFKSVWPQHQLGHFKLSATASTAPHDDDGISPAIFAILQTPPDKRTPKQTQDLTAFFRASYAGELTEADRALVKARGAKADFEKNIPTVMVMEELPKPREAHLLLRGQYDKPGDVVTPNTPACLPPLRIAVGPQAHVPSTQPTRLDFARWIVSPENPLTPRVTVNRLWENLFGIGLVKTSENFGSQAEWPSHPELLDWLATEFVATGWDLKATLKTIVTSATYRQASAISPGIVERDPENRLLSHGPRFRVQAEMIRDQALAIAGLLHEQVGGPSARPYQPPGIWDELSVYGNLHNYKPDQAGNQYRRSLYTIWKRTTPPPAMNLFDMPGRETCIVKRSRTNTPLQALNLLNDETYVESARVLAQHMLTEAGPTPRERITYAFRHATARPPTDRELTLLTKGLEARIARFKANPDDARKLIAVGDSKVPTNLDPAELAAYTTTASVILNLDETITKE